jgi:hypothetical protein
VDLIGDSWMQTAPRRAVALAPVYVGDAGPAAGARAVGHLKRTGIKLLAAAQMRLTQPTAERTVLITGKSKIGENSQLEAGRDVGEGKKVVSKGRP